MITHNYSVESKNIEFLRFILEDAILIEIDAVICFDLENERAALVTPYKTDASIIKKAIRKSITVLNGRKKLSSSVILEGMRLSNRNS